MTELGDATASISRLQLEVNALRKTELELQQKYDQASSTAQQAKQELTQHRHTEQSKYPYIRNIPG